MKDHTRNLSPNTVAFHCLEPAVAVLINDIILAISSVLSWRQSSKSLLAEILSRLAENELFEQGHEEFSSALWPYQEAKKRVERFSRWLSRLKEDMKLSGFQAVWVAKRRVERTESGGYKGLPTQYKRAEFWKLFRAVQDAALKCDLLALPVRKRRVEVRAIVAAWLTEAGAETIVREKKVEEIKPAKPSLPCNCNCASCVLCSAKNSATASEANGRVASPQGERVTRESVEKELHALNDRIFECGQRWMNLGLKLDDFNGKVHRDYADMIRRLAGAVKRANAPSVKLVGGQPK